MIGLNGPDVRSDIATYCFGMCIAVLEVEFVVSYGHRSYFLITPTVGTGIFFFFEPEVKKRLASKIPAFMWTWP